jgi:hypothetical protein
MIELRKVRPIQLLLSNLNLHTGQRLGDIARLTWSNVDLDKNKIRFVTQKSRVMTLPMAAPLRKHIESLPAGDDPGAPLHPRCASVSNFCTLSNQFAQGPGQQAQRLPVDLERDVASAADGRRAEHASALPDRLAVTDERGRGPDAGGLAGQPVRLPGPGSDQDDQEREQRLHRGGKR